MTVLDTAYIFHHWSRQSDDAIRFSGPVRGAAYFTLMLTTCRWKGCHLQRCKLTAGFLLIGWIYCRSRFGGHLHSGISPNAADETTFSVGRAFLFVLCLVISVCARGVYKYARCVVLSCFLGLSLKLFPLRRPFLCSRHKTLQDVASVTIIYQKSILNHKSENSLEYPCFMFLFRRLFEWSLQVELHRCLNTCPIPTRFTTYMTSATMDTTTDDKSKNPTSDQKYVFPFTPLCHPPR